MQVHNPRQSAGAGLRRRPGRLPFRVGCDPRRGVRRRRDRARPAARTRRDARSTLAGAGARDRRGARRCRGVGVEVREHADLDRDPGEHDEAYLDVWTPEVAPRVARLRASGARIRCLGDLVLERARGPDDRHHRHGRQDDDGVVPRRAPAQAGVGSRAARPPAPGTSGRPPSSLPTRPTAGVVVLELTSSHLCFTTHSPTSRSSRRSGPTTSSSTARSSATAPRRRRSSAPVGGRRGRGERRRRGRGRDRLRSHPVDGSSSRSRARSRRAPSSSAGRSSCADAGRGARAPLPPGLDGPRLQALLGALAAASPSARGPRRWAAPAAAVPHGRRRPARRYRARRRRDVGDADEDRRRASPRSAGRRSCSSPEASSRAPARPSTRRRRSNDCSWTRARRHAVPLASSSSSAPRRNGSRRCSTPPDARGDEPR